MIYEKTLQPLEDDRGVIKIWGFADRRRRVKIVISEPVDGLTTVTRHVFLDTGSEISPKGVTIGTCPQERREALLQQIEADLTANGYAKGG